MENKIVIEAESTFNGLIDILSTFNQQEINTVPFEGSWTPGQVADHMIKSDGGFLELLNGPVEVTQRKPDEGVEGIRARFLDFSTKMQSPDFVIPENKNFVKASLLSTLENIKVGTIKAIKELDLTKTCTGFELPFAGKLTRLEAVYFVIYHTQRNTHQLKKISASLI